MRRRVLFCWQGSIYLFAGVIAPYLTQSMMTEISLLGGIFLLSSGVGILQLRDCKTLNMLPSLLVPPLWFYYFKFFTAILTEKYIIMLHCVDELAGNVYN